MKLAEFDKVLNTIGIPVTYYAFPEEEAPALPYICYLVTGSKNMFADGVVYEKILQLQVELYTQLKDVNIEDKVESALASFAWQKTETYIDSQKCYQIIYEIEV